MKVGWNWTCTTKLETSKTGPVYSWINITRKPMIQTLKWVLFRYWFHWPCKRWPAVGVISWIDGHNGSLSLSLSLCWWISTLCSTCLFDFSHLKDAEKKLKRESRISITIMLFKLIIWRIIIIQKNIFKILNFIISVIVLKMIGILNWKVMKRIDLPFVEAIRVENGLTAVTCLLSVYSLIRNCNWLYSTQQTTLKC